MKLKLLTGVVALVASVLANAGELDGKAIVCHDIEYPESAVYYEFRDGKAWVSGVNQDGVKAVIVKEWSGIDYATEPNRVRWQSGPGEDQWNYLWRETLKMEYIYVPENRVYFEYQCEVSGSLAEYHEAMERERTAQQEKIDEQMKDNKI